MGSRDEAVLKIKSAFVSISKKAILAHLITQFPFLAHPFLQKLLETIILDPLLKSLSNNSEMMIFFLYIDWRGNEQAKEWVLAAQKNHLAQQNGTPEEKKEAEDALWKAASNFIRYNA